MENEDTIYKNDKDESFIEYVFSKEPQPQGSIKLECGLPAEGKILILFIRTIATDLYIDSFTI